MREKRHEPKALARQLLHTWNDQDMRELDLGPVTGSSAEQCECFICMSCSGHPDTAVLDQALRKRADVGAVIAGAGPLSVGYVLLVPHAHVGDIATALRECSGFQEFVEDSLAEYEQLFGSYTIWEHGSPTLGRRTSGCVAHAHLNVVPRLPLTAPPAAERLGGWQAFRAHAAPPYLLLGGSGQPLQVGPDSGIAQHYRREWARHVGHADLWDYAIGGLPGLQAQTISRYVAGR